LQGILEGWIDIGYPSRTIFCPSCADVRRNILEQKQRRLLKEKEMKIGYKWREDTSIDLLSNRIVFLEKNATSDISYTLSLMKDTLLLMRAEYE
jgi:hypothetical protein